MRRLVLVIEDDAAIRRGVADALEFEGYAVVQHARGDEGLRAALSEPIDLLLLDLVLPGREGLEILYELRRVRPTLPVIVLTARGEEADRVRGLRLGADDYVVKPFSIRELLARVTAVLRRSPERPDELLCVPIPGGLVDLQRREVAFDDGSKAELSEREAALVRYLAASPQRAIAREEILSRVWCVDPKGVETRTIDMHMVRLREKLRDPAAAPRVILTVRGKGYKWGA